MSLNPVLSKPDERLAPSPLAQHASNLGRFLVERGHVSAAQIMVARSAQARMETTLDQYLVLEGMIGAAEMVEALSQYYDLPLISLADTPSDTSLMALLDARFCIKHSIIPWRSNDGTILIATAHPEAFAGIQSRLPEDFPPTRAVIAQTDEIRATLAAWHRPNLTLAASARVAEHESCRTWGQKSFFRVGVLVAILACFAALCIAAPTLIFGGLVLWATFTLSVAAILRTAAYIAHLSAPKEAVPPPQPHAYPTSRREGPKRLPKISVLVPLFKETEIAGALVERLSRLSYPTALLDVVLVLEENDTLTRDTIAACDLPRWMRVVKVPEGGPKTKPRAMNYALDFCDGEIIGIWDAEDAPDPDQLSRVAARFSNGPDDLVCLQGVLDYYNPRQNWLARCFTVEYAAWFRLMMPGMARLGFAIPLGGTTLFFRRDALEQLGGWDAHNVTEDADLGFRLARHGYRTEMLDTVTGEEANCRLWPWVRQRSRWLKGYMVTYLVHMRQPRLLYRQLGAWKFWGFQAHFVTALSQFILAPFLWSFWLVLFGLPHPLDAVMPRETLLAFGVLFLLVEFLTILVNATAVYTQSHRHLLLWVPLLHFYYPLGALAAYKALFELIFRPFYWDKTQHGISLGKRRTAALPPQFRTTRIKLEPRYKGL